MIASWSAIGGILIGLIVTLFAGRWLANVVMFGAVGFIVGALIDRHRK